MRFIKGFFKSLFFTYIAYMFFYTGTSQNFLVATLDNAYGQTEFGMQVYKSKMPEYDWLLAFSAYNDMNGYANFGFQKRVKHFTWQEMIQQTPKFAQMPPLFDSADYADASPSPETYIFYFSDEEYERFSYDFQQKIISVGLLDPNDKFILSLEDYRERRELYPKDIMEKQYRIPVQDSRERILVHIKANPQATHASYNIQVLIRTE